jgi:ParB family chromosome partitioning protein
MLGDDNPTRPMADRHFRYIPVDLINVPNPRKRCKEQFQKIMQSIKINGLKKPIMVNMRNFESTGKYELVFGQGRWEIHKILGIKSILAEVINEDVGKAYVYSLVENIARSRPKPLEFAKFIIQMYDSGVTFAKLVDITGRSQKCLRDYVALMKKGERNLIKGVEQGIIPISFAMRVVQSDDIASQSVLMEAFEAGIVTEANLQSVRKILENRKRVGEYDRCKNLDELTTSMQEASAEISDDCEYVKKKETRLRRLLHLIGEVKKDSEVIRLAKEQGISLTLKLKLSPEVRKNLLSDQIKQENNNESQ